MRSLVVLAVLIGLPIVGYMMMGWVGIIVGIGIATMIPQLPGE